MLISEGGFGCITSLSIVAAWRFVRFDESFWFVATVSSIVWFSSTFEDEAGFRARVDWRVGVIGTTGAFALAREDLLLTSVVVPASVATDTSGTLSFVVVVSTAGGGAVSTVDVGTDDEPSLAVSTGVDDTGSVSVDETVGSTWLGFSVEVVYSAGLTSLFVSSVGFSFCPLTCTVDESAVLIFSVVPFVIFSFDVVLLTAVSFCPLTTGSDCGITFSLSLILLFVDDWLFVWDIKPLPNTGSVVDGVNSSTDCIFVL